MNNKVGELVEWVAKGLRYEIKKGTISWELLDDGARAYWQHLAKVVLSHPDLALIDRGKTPCHIVLLGDDATYYPIIPLAEALKEKA